MILALSCFAPAALAGDFSTPEDVLAQFKEEPSIADVQAMALDYSKTDPHYLDGWMRAAKSAAALPALTLYYNYKDSYGQDYGYYTAEDAQSHAGSGTFLTSDEIADLEAGPFLTGQSTDDYNVFSARATWQLNELVMSSDQIRIINEAQDIVKLRDKVMEEVTRLYFERRRLQVDMLLGSSGELKKRVADELRLAELTAQLDAYTGGRFSQGLRKK